MANLQSINLGTGRIAKAISAGGYHSCALLDDDTVKCWGSGQYGQLGQDSKENWGDGGTNEMANLKHINLGNDRTAKAISAGWTHSCALLDDDTVKCWGYEKYGRLGQDSGDNWGDGGTNEMANLQPINLGTGRTAKAISAGRFHTCALLDNGKVKCWGRGDNGQLGQDSQDKLGDEEGEMAELVAINLGNDRTAKAISAGTFHTCALLDDDTVKCWGEGLNGQLGQDSQDKLGDEEGEMAELVAINLGNDRTAKAISAGTFHTCALLDDDTVKCWGEGLNGQLGQDSQDKLGDEEGEMAELVAINLGTGRTTKAISAGDKYTCALLDDDKIKCWGKGEYGRLGQNSTENLGDGVDENDNPKDEMGDNLPPIKL